MYTNTGYSAHLIEAKSEEMSVAVDVEEHWVNIFVNISKENSPDHANYEVHFYPRPSCLAVSRSLARKIKDALESALNGPDTAREEEE
jgi:hypothetical protein